MLIQSKALKVDTNPYGLGVRTIKSPRKDHIPAQKQSSRVDAPKLETEMKNPGVKPKTQPTSPRSNTSAKIKPQKRT